MTQQTIAHNQTECVCVPQECREPSVEPRGPRPLAHHAGVAPMTVHAGIRPCACWPLMFWVSSLFVQNPKQIPLFQTNNDPKLFQTDLKN